VDKPLDNRCRLRAAPRRFPQERTLGLLPRRCPLEAVDEIGAGDMDNPLGHYKGDQSEVTLLSLRIVRDRDGRRLLVVGALTAEGRMAHREEIPFGKGEVVPARQLGPWMDGFMAYVEVIATRAVLVAVGGEQQALDV
jgi:hypothetical protein